MKILPVKYYQSRARVFVYLVCFSMAVYVIFRVLAELV